MSITVYTKPACVQCNATYKALDKQGIAYEKVDISLDPDARDYVMALGYLQAPVVVADQHGSVAAGVQAERPPAGAADDAALAGAGVDAHDAAIVQAGDDVAVLVEGDVFGTRTAGAESAGDGEFGGGGGAALVGRHRRWAPGPGREQSSAGSHRREPTCRLGPAGGAFHTFAGRPSARRPG